MKPQRYSQLQVHNMSRSTLENLFLRFQKKNELATELNDIQFKELTKYSELNRRLEEENKELRKALDTLLIDDDIKSEDEENE